MTQTTISDATPRAETEPNGQNVRADHVEIVQGGASRVDAISVDIRQGGAGLVRAGEMSVSQGGIGLASAERINLREGSSVVAVAAGEAHLDAGANVLLLLARNASGNVRPVLDWRAMAALGAAFGIVAALLRRR
ncbi:MAG TPA: hypothetical protein VNT28_07555 [Candidatus Limnocylindrales bacterium]|nr:hypothetical protein [Candidatus Limnocylindrales bacterium]